MVKKQKNYSKSKNDKKMPKKLKIFSLKIHKAAGIFKKPQKLYETKVPNIKKIIWKL